MYILYVYNMYYFSGAQKREGKVLLTFPDALNKANSTKE